MEFHNKKCKILELGRGTRRPRWNHKMGSNQIKKGKDENDFRFTFNTICLQKIHNRHYRSKIKVLTCRSNEALRHCNNYVRMVPLEYSLH